MLDPYSHDRWPLGILQDSLIIIKTPSVLNLVGMRAPNVVNESISICILTSAAPFTCVSRCLRDSHVCVCSPKLRSRSALTIFDKLISKFSDLHPYCLGIAVIPCALLNTFNDSRMIAGFTIGGADVWQIGRTLQSRVPKILTFTVLFLEHLINHFLLTLVDGFLFHETW